MNPTARAAGRHATHGTWSGSILWTGGVPSAGRPAGETPGRSRPMPRTPNYRPAYKRTSLRGLLHEFWRRRRAARDAQISTWELIEYWRATQRGRKAIR